METFGYTGKILRVDLSSGSITEIPTMDYADRFLGGRGIAAKICWDEVPPEVKAFDAENRIVFATGPLCGVPTIGGSRWTVCGKSAFSTPEHFNHGNLGGRWGAELKFAGYDAIVVQGKSEKPVYLFLHDETAELKDASDLWGKGSLDTREILKSELGNSVRVVAVGPAGENMAILANLMADNDASGSGGLGAVMGSKRLKAIAVSGAGKKVKIAQPERFKELVAYYHQLDRAFPLDNISRWSKDLIEDFRTIPGPEMKKNVCYGCTGKCARRDYEAADGKKGKFICGSAYFYQQWAERYYGEWNDVPFHATKLCDNYGLDAVHIDMMIGWLYRCHEAGVLTDENTGIPISKIGSPEFMETLMKKVSFREGFGDLLAQGIEKAAESVGLGAVELVEMTGILGETRYQHVYDPRLYIITGLVHAMEPRLVEHQLHEVGYILSKFWAGTKGLTPFTGEVVRAIGKKFWGSEIAADFSTYEGKALAVKKIQDREYPKESLILCDFLWPLSGLDTYEDHVGDPTLESKILSAVTGQEVDEEGLYRIGERIFNLCRAMLVREGHQGRNSDVLPDYLHTIPFEYEFPNPDGVVPGKDGEVLCRKGEVLERDKFEKMKDEYYQLRQWDVTTGLQTRANLEELDLKEVADDLEKRGLLGSS